MEPQRPNFSVTSNFLGWLVFRFTIILYQNRFQVQETEVLNIFLSIFVLLEIKSSFNMKIFESVCVVETKQKKNRKLEIAALPKNR